MNVCNKNVITGIQQSNEWITHLPWRFETDCLQKRAPWQHDASVLVNTQPEWNVGIGDRNRKFLIISYVKEATLVPVKSVGMKVHGRLQTTERQDCKLSKSKHKHFVEGVVIGASCWFYPRPRTVNAPMLVPIANGSENLAKEQHMNVQISWKVFSPSKVCRLANLWGNWPTDWITGWLAYWLPDWPIRVTFPQKKQITKLTRRALAEEGWRSASQLHP